MISTILATLSRGLALGVTLWILAANVSCANRNDVYFHTILLAPGPTTDAELIDWLTTQPGLMSLEVRRHDIELEIRYLFTRSAEDADRLKRVEESLRRFGYGQPSRGFPDYVGNNYERHGPGPMGSVFPFYLLTEANPSSERIRFGLALAVGVGCMLVRGRVTRFP